MKKVDIKATENYWKGVYGFRKEFRHSLDITEEMAKADSLEKAKKIATNYVLNLRLNEMEILVTRGRKVDDFFLDDLAIHRESFEEMVYEANEVLPFSNPLQLEELLKIGELVETARFIYEKPSVQEYHSLYNFCMERGLHHQIDIIQRNIANA